MSEHSGPTGGTPLEPGSGRGSLWHRWEPHVHTPGTVLNDQFTGADAWQRYLEKIEGATPVISALGVTDYYSTSTYERVLTAKAQGRLPNCGLIFSNVEMRLAVGTVKGRWANLHLLVSPDDPNHLQELWRFLSRLSFDAYADSFNCTRTDLIKLGRKVDSKLEGASALEKGATQFKVTFPQLVSLYSASAWAKDNIIVAVAGSETDGTSGIRDAADATLRQEIERFAHVIFASSASQRDFWLGRKSATAEVLRDRYGGLKPCMHGSDGHDHQSAGTPDEERYSWVKGAVAFDSLRQAIIDPVRRAYVAPIPPFRASPSQVISTVRIRGAEWLRTPTIELNPGLVAIIGARGSGKTALADAIAAGCEATSGRLSDASFVVRARELLHGVSVTLDWESGGPSDRPLVDSHADDTTYPRARYLSQKFVETLCSATGMTDDLLREIERVIFEAHSPADRDGTVDFDELLALRAARPRQMRARQREAISTLSDRIGIEREKEIQVSGLKLEIKRRQDIIAGYNKDREKLVAKGSEERVTRLGALTSAAERVRGYLRYFANQEQSLLSLQDDVAAFRQYRAPEELRQTKETFKASDIGEEHWKPFLLKHSGDVDGTLEELLKGCLKSADSWRGIAPAVADPNRQLIAADAKIDELPLAVLEAEIARLQKLINVDNDTARRYTEISRRIAEENAALERVLKAQQDCEQAHVRAKQLYQDREGAYRHVFEAICAEETLLRDLYAPLMERLIEAQGALRKLSFAVSRRADVKRWAAQGEDLFDLRRQGPFKGRGTLEQWAETTLKSAWESGDPAAVAQAMATFREQNQSELLDLAKVPRTHQADYRSWLMRFAKWIYGTEHIEIRYSIDYEGTDIRKLSPGTRGIVLLLLYLALDDADDRPLIIDQPEENLDPKSIFDELVNLFVIAKDKRQVILVTHNANLVVNTDADQIIVATAGTHAPGELPSITYLSGGLEIASIRKQVCDILEGGEEAFKERARRLRVTLHR
jgi:energy-coupling factor transporter ATP-binding protein EcfA2